MIHSPKKKSTNKPKPKQKLQAGSKKRKPGPKIVPRKILARTPDRKILIPSSQVDRNKWDLPPEIPRTRETLKILAKEAPDMVIEVIRKWLKEK